MLEEKDVGKEYLVGTTIPCLLHCNWMVPKLNYYGEKLNSSTSLQDKTKPLAILEKELSLESNYAFSRGRNYQGQAPSPRSLPTMSKESRGRSQKIEKKRKSLAVRGLFFPLTADPWASPPFPKLGQLLQC